MEKKLSRIIYLDSIRGIAAMMVVFYHFIGWRLDGTRTYHLASFVFNGSDAVSFFFVLSGFVLSYKYIHSDAQINIKKFTFNRVLRLYPAFIVTVLLNYLYWNRNNLGLNILREVFIDFKPDLWGELIMVRGQHNFYNPGWTLGVEMGMSLLMPFLTIVAIKNVKLIGWLIPLSIFMGPTYICKFTLHFCLGIILAYYYPQIKAYNFKESKYYAYRWLIAILVFLLFSIRHIERMVGFGEVYEKIIDFFKIYTFHYTGIASFFILLFVINNKKSQELLSGKVLNFIGKISYSIYLTHWLIIIVIMDNWGKFEAFFGSSQVTFFAMIIVTIAAVLLSSTFMYYYIEKPFIALSKRISSKFS